MKVLTHTYLLIFAALATLLGACTDELAAPDGAVGGMVDMQVTIGVPNADRREVLSRGNTGTLNQQVYDLVVFAFKENGDLISKYYFSDIGEGVTPCTPLGDSDNLASITLETGHEADGCILNMRVPTGRGYLMAVGNAGIESTDFLHQVLGVQTRAELLALECHDWQFDSEVQTMAGAYMAAYDATNATFNPAEVVTFQSGHLPGRIHLRPTSAAVKVNINGKGPASAGGYFALSSYRIVNLPTATALYHDDEYVHGRADVYNSPDVTVFNEEPSYKYNFAFSVLDYMATGSEAIRTYGDRARWNPADQTAGAERVFANAPATAPYLILKGSYRGKSAYVDESGVQQPASNVVAEVEYYIFLGHDSGEGTIEGYRDFTTRRNWEYTYNITVNGVNEITVEVNKKVENRPDAEGDVIVMDNANSHEFDSHYCQSEFTVTVAQMRQWKKQGLIAFRAVAPAYGVDEVCVYDGTNRNSNFGIYDESGNKLAETTSNGHLKKGDMDRKNLACVAADWLRFYEIPQADLAKDDAKLVQVNFTEVFKGVNGSNNPKLLTIYRFLQRIYNIANDTSIPADRTYTFCVFAQENYYDNNWNDRMLMNHGSSGTAGTVHWSQFVNQPDRRVLLFANTQYSGDRESSFSRPGRVFAQRSIWTVYNPVAGTRAWGTESKEEYIQKYVASGGATPAWFTGSDWTAARRTLRVAFVNASGGRSWMNGQNDPSISMKVPFLKSMSSVGHKYGRFAAFRTLKGQSWTDWMDFGVKYENNLHYRLNGSILKTADDRNKMGAVTDMIVGCLSRNRDLNGNGKIDANEIRWYVPSIRQLQTLYMGNTGLPVEARLYQTESNNGQWHYKHYYSATRYAGDQTNQIMWAEEGPSTGQVHSSYAFGVHVRCVRDLGVTLTDTTSAQWNDFYVHHATPRGHAAGYIDITQMNANSIRQTLALKDLSGIVTTFSASNRPASRFEYANRVINTGRRLQYTNTSGTVYDVPDWTDPNIRNITYENSRSEQTPQLQSLCAKTFGQGWRTPTISELGILYWSGAFQRSDDLLSRTRYTFYNRPGTSLYGTDYLTGRSNDQRGRDPHSFCQDQFRLRYPMSQIRYPASTKPADVTNSDISQIGGHYGGILCVRDKID